MGRPLGSKNKPKIKPRHDHMAVIKLSKDIDGSAITHPSSFGWVRWGSDNMYPNKLLALYNQSPTHHSCISFAAMSICGNGIDYDAMSLDKSQTVPNADYSWDELLKRIALDFVIYGSYAIQIIANNDGQSYSFYHTPLDKVRWGEYDEDGNIQTYYISSDWSNVSMYPPIELEAFDGKKAIRRGRPYLYVYRNYSPTMDYYTSPHYIAGLKAIQADIEAVNFDLKCAVNSFTPSGMLVLDDVETDEERRDIIDNISALFTGSEGANSVMISFRNNVEQKSPEFIPFQASSSNVNLFGEANQRNINRILAAHQIPNASLVGMPDMVGSGFASEAAKLETAYQLYEKLTGNYNRMAVVQTLNTLFAINGVDVEIVLKPLSFNDFDEDANVEERTTVDVDDEDVNNLQANAEEE